MIVAGPFDEGQERDIVTVKLNNGAQLEGVLADIPNTLVKPDSIHWNAESGGKCWIKGNELEVDTEDGLPSVELPLHHESRDEEMNWVKEAEKEMRLSNVTSGDKTLLIQLTHKSLLHPGKERTYKYFSPWLKFTMEDIERAIGNCVICQKRNAVKRKVHSTVQDTRGQRILHADIGYMGQVSKLGRSMISVIYEKVSGYIFIKAITTKDEATDHVVDEINNLFRKGIHLNGLHTDNGMEYVNRRMEGILRSKNMTRYNNPKRSKESNGVAERAVRTAKEMIATALEVGRIDHEDWDSTVEWVEYAHNITPRKDGGNPWETMWGSPSPRYMMPLRTIVVKEMDALDGINLPGVTGRFTSYNAKDGTVEYILCENGDISFRSEHSRYANFPKTTLSCWAGNFRPKGVFRIGNIRIKDYLSAPEEFKRSIDKEWKAFQKHQVFTEEQRGRPIVPLFWIHSMKDAITAKSRLVCAGNKIKFEENRVAISTSPPDLSHLWTLISLMPGTWRIGVGDISSAFLHAENTIESVNVKLPTVLPPGTGFKPNQVVGIQRAIYGLRSAPKDWEKHFAKIILEETQGEEVTSNVFWTGRIWVYNYVDDYVLVGEEPEIWQVNEKIKNRVVVGRFEVLQEGKPIKLLGGTMSWESSGIRWSMTKYIQGSAKERPRGAINLNAITCGMGTADQTLKPVIQERLGVLGWIGRFLPVVGLIHSILSNKALRHPCQKILNAIEMVIHDSAKLEPLKWTCIDTGKVLIYTDASYIRDELQAQLGAIIGYATEVGTAMNVCTFKSKRLKRKVLSTFAAELYAVIMGIKLYAGIVPLLSRFKIKETVLLVDNEAVVKSITSGRTEDPMARGIVDWIRQSINEFGISIRWVPTDKQMADDLTKFKRGTWASIESLDRGSVR